MIYPSDFRQRIGFDVVCADVEQRLQTDGGRQLLDEVRFSADYREVRRLAGECAEMLSLLRSVDGGDVPKSGYVDISSFLPKARIIGGFIEANEMLQLATAIELVADLIRFFSTHSEGYDYLRAIGDGIEPQEHIATEIHRIVDKFGNVRDNASPELARIRKELTERSGQISRRLHQILQRAQADGYADADSSVSIRDGRAVIPVAAGHKRKIKGFVFDESASGRTAYIEPIEVIELNNEVRELQNSERYEIVRILTTFAELLRPAIDDLERVGEYLCYFDFLLAKARYADDVMGALPLLEDRPMLDLRRARHPLLEKVFRAEGKAEELIPLEARLTEQKPILLISGPNAGGKSVCLKTVGLLQYMLQCGFLPPVSEVSQMGIFDSIFIDIGDQQSIDNDLSTYSSHLLNMKTVLREATDRSLVLIDEFGGGTEPNAGGAIAEAILTQFVERGVYGVITTHYANLKYFAASHGGIENGAMMFDTAAIRPLYRLEMGAAGNSYAFEIARKIGLSETVLAAAAEIVGEDKMSLEKQLREAMRDKRYWETKREKIRVASKTTDRVAAEYESQLSEIQTERARLIKAAKAEAAKIVSDANALIENTIREIKEAAAERERTRVVRKKVEEFKAEVETDTVCDELIERKIEQMRERERRREQRSKERAEQRLLPKAEHQPVVLPIEVGSQVRLDGGSMGEVLAISGKKAVVAFGALSSTVDLSRLTAVSAKAIKPQKSALVGVSGRTTAAGVALEAAVQFSPEIDIRGMRAAEAFEVVQQFVDQAIMLGQRRIRILHGKGTGVLKEEVRRYLRSEPMVKSAKDEHEQMGGAGITVVEFNT